MKTVNKWFFKDFKRSIHYLHYRKEIPFLAWSDLALTDYDKIGAVLDRINLNKQCLISVGKTPAPYGFTVDPTDEDLNKLLNSCQYSFIMTDKLNELDFLLMCVLTRIKPICNKNHPMIKHLGLSSFATTPNKLLDKLVEIKYHSYIFNRRIALLSWRSNVKLKKWHKNE